ncbi:hypothetical protein CDD83_8817 [Cordyceps sp. RAO-2017]|nr:hypothetical protein CDD83_8817 [Cordyceps sp. RAO-2017]
MVAAAALLGSRAPRTVPLPWLTTLLSALGSDALNSPPAAPLKAGPTQPSHQPCHAAANDLTGGRARLARLFGPPLLIPTGLATLGKPAADNTSGTVRLSWTLGLMHQTNQSPACSTCMQQSTGHAFRLQRYQGICHHHPLGGEEDARIHDEYDGKGGGRNRDEDGDYVSTSASMGSSNTRNHLCRPSRRQPGS